MPTSKNLKIMLIKKIARERQQRLSGLKPQNINEAKEAILTTLPEKENGSFSHYLRKALATACLSGYELSKKCGLDKSTIGKLLKETSDPKYSTIVKLAKGLQLSLSELFEKAIVTDKVATKTKHVSPNFELSESEKNFIDKMRNMHRQDTELLNVIADILVKRKISAIEKLLHVNKTKSPIKNNKEENKKMEEDDDDLDDIYKDEDDEDDNFDDIDDSDEVDDVENYDQWLSDEDEDDDNEDDEDDLEDDFDDDTYEEFDE